MNSVSSFFALALLAAQTALLCMAALRLFRLLRGEGKRRMLSRSHGYGSDAMSETGISVLVAGLPEPEEVERHLSLDYMRYEVILVAQRDDEPARFAELLRRYSMIRVNYAPTDELPAEPSCLLYRSRQRRYRRLVMVDHPPGPSSERVNCGAMLARYEYLIPLPQGVELMPDALQRLVAELHESAARQPEAVVGEVAPGSLVRAQRIALFSREAVVEQGGFTHDLYPASRLLAHLKRSGGRIVRLWQPIARRNDCAPRARARAGRLALACLLLVLAAMLVYAVATLRGYEALLLLLCIASLYATGVVLGAASLYLSTRLDRCRRFSAPRSAKSVLGCSARIF